MPDDFDRTTDLVERERESCIERARREINRRPGPYQCMLCGQTNDRRIDGWATCFDCAEDSYASR